jgi:hypothetical protein
MPFCVIRTQVHALYQDRQHTIPILILFSAACFGSVTLPHQPLKTNAYDRKIMHSASSVQCFWYQWLCLRPDDGAWLMPKHVTENQLLKIDVVH